MWGGERNTSVSGQDLVVISCKEDHEILLFIKSLKFFERLTYWHICKRESLSCSTINLNKTDNVGTNATFRRVRDFRQKKIIQPTVCRFLLLNHPNARNIYKGNLYYLSNICLCVRMLFWFNFQASSKMFFILRRIQRGTIIRVSRSSRKVSIILVGF